MQINQTGSEANTTNKSKILGSPFLESHFIRPAYDQSKSVAPELILIETNIHVFGYDYPIGEILYHSGNHEN